VLPIKKIRCVSCGEDIITPSYDKDPKICDKCFSKVCSTYDDPQSVIEDLMHENNCMSKMQNDFKL
jgi:DNA-directed RNA polymerase subunit N (RpoN/RPB10)